MNRDHVRKAGIADFMDIVVIYDLLNRLQSCTLSSLLNSEQPSVFGRCVILLCSDTCGKVDNGDIFHRLWQSADGA